MVLRGLSVASKRRLLLLFIFRSAAFSEYVIYRAEQFVFSEVICGEEGERLREFIRYPLLTHQVIIVWERET